MIKKILLFIFKKESLFVKLLKILKNSIIIFKRVAEIKIYYSFTLFIKIIQGQVLYEAHNRQTNLGKQLSKYKFDYPDWFSYNIPIWNIIINNLERIYYLEIGCFEGRSVVYIAERKKTKSITAVDTWKGSDEHEKINFNKVFLNFKKNIFKFKNKIKFYKETSDNFFKKNKKKYNLIYIDGSHHYNDVKKDLQYAMKFSKKGGYIICDDFLWNYYKKKEENAMKAILEIYFYNKSKFEIYYLNYQIIFKKI